MDERLKQQLEFVLEIDKEKNIFRQTHLQWHHAILQKAAATSPVSGF